MARLSSAGARITVVVATDGEGSHPGLRRPTPPAQLAAIRREEVQRAVRCRSRRRPTSASCAARLRTAGAARRAARPARAGARRGRIGDGGAAPRTLVVAPWSGDGHRDHRVTAEVVGELCAERGIRHLGYPIWLWHWGAPGDVPWGDSRGTHADAEERAAKRSALDEHRTQIHPLSPNAGDEPVLHDRMQAHFLRSREVFIHEAAPVRTVPTAALRRLLPPSRTTRGGSSRDGTSSASATC